MPNKDTIEKTIKELNSSIPVDGEIDYYNQTKEVPWSTRRIGIMNDVLFNRPDIFTVNEGLHRQVNDLKELLKMEFIGVGREDGKTKGEYQAIYYDSKKFQLLDYDTFWLSHDPFNPSKYRWAGSYRSCTVGHFKDISTGVSFILINFHLDDQSDYARQLGAAMAKYRAAYEYETKKVPVILVGDFNSESTGERSGAYLVATGKKEFDVEENLNEEFLKKYKHSLTKFEFVDFLEACPVQSRMGHFATFTGFEGSTKLYSRIDFQLGGHPHNGDELKWEVVRHKTGDNWYDNSYYLSDHRPVITDLILKK
ncbi:unnamed protein product [Ambrosiozyma monospora]|uniref:Unnamed protein product n=1 Tax=Ambrosiozyma monospora TaxID=43982 RepID=A0ACB5T2J7_AMBMO|nr:unnamed protein product [Ambrosiozyma monospora]